MNTIASAAESVSIDDGYIAFEGVGDGSLRDIYAERDGTIKKFVATGDIVDGRTVSNVSIGRDGFSNGHAAIRLSFDESGTTFYATYSKHRWNPTNDDGGSWITKANGPLGALPGPSVPTYIQPDGPALTNGPFTTTHMHSLAIGAQSFGTAELRLSTSGQILINHTFTLVPALKLSGYGALSANEGITNHGTIDLSINSITIAGSILNNHALIQGQETIDNPLNNQPTGEIRAQSDTTIQFNDTANQNQGHLSLLSGPLDFTQDLTNTSAAQNDGRGILSTGTGLTKQERINLSASFTDIFGNVSSAGGFTGAGTIQFEGIFSLCDSPSSLTIEAHTTLTPTSNLILELADLTPDTQHDELTFTNNIHANGQLTIALLNDYHPQLNDTLQILNLTTTTGHFTTTNLSTLNHGLAFDATNRLTTGTLAVVPEPTTFAVFVFITAALTYRRNSKQSVTTNPLKQVEQQ